MNCKLFLSSFLKRNAQSSHKNSKQDASSVNFENINFYVGHKSISDVINLAPPEHLENIVCRNFLIIFKNSLASEYCHFSMYSSWKKLLLENIDLAILNVRYPEDFNALINIFPEHEAELYNELLKGFIDEELNDFARSNFSIAEDVLIPIAYLEKYCKVPALNVRKYVKELLIATYTFEEFYDTINVLENYFDIPYKDMRVFINEIFQEEIEMWINKKRNINDTGILEEFFSSSEAYDLFMKNLAAILHSQGIELYAYLLKTLGPREELIENEYACYEYET